MFLYDILRNHTLRSIQNMIPQNGHTPYEPEADSLLYITANSLPYHLNGYALRTHALLTALLQTGIKVHALTQAGYPRHYKEMAYNTQEESTTYDNIQYQHNLPPRKFLRLVPFIQKVADAIMAYATQHKVSCIHAASDYVNALPALVAARKLGIPFQYEMRGLWELSRAAQRSYYPYWYSYGLGICFERFVARQADRVFCISKSLAAFMDLPIDAEKISILPNCINEENYPTVQCLEPHPFHIGYAGALVQYEGLDVLLHALKKVVQTQKNVFLHIIGDGKAKKKLVAFTKKLRLQKHVQFYGKLSPEATKQHLASCILLCIPRTAQDVCQIVPPIKLVEAMALGKAVVVPDLPVFREETEHAPVFYFQAGNSSHLAKVLSCALQNPQELIQRGQNCRNVVLKHRQWKYFAQNIVPLGRNK